jgi:curli production assembly/transport component CsgF
MRPYLFFICILGFYFNTNAQALVYKPLNPNFGGGDTFGYQQLLSSADAQNDFKQSQQSGYTPPTQAEQFKQNLNNQLLNRLSSSLLNNQFGSSTGGTGTGTTGGTGGGLAPGTYTFGTLSVDVFPSNLGLTVNILDIETGEQTQVIVPGN